jgi:hypothetical protein
MKNIATHLLMTGTMIGFSPKTALASHPVQTVMGVGLKMGNGRPESTLFI